MMHTDRANCLEQLRLFVAEPTNERKLELYLAYDAIAEQERTQVLGEALDTLLSRILIENHHPDLFLQQIVWEAL